MSEISEKKNCITMANVISIINEFDDKKIQQQNSKSAWISYDSALNVQFIQFGNSKMS